MYIPTLIRFLYPKALHMQVIAIILLCCSYNTTIQHIYTCRQDQHGRFMTAVTDDGLIFCQDCRPSSQFAVLGYTGKFYVTNSGYIITQGHVLYVTSCVHVQIY